MTSSLIVRLAVVGLVATVLAGCISHEQTVYRDESRVPIEFENEAAGRLFYETLSKAPSDRNKSESTTRVSLPIVFSHKERVVRGENTAFNSAVRECDTNRDGRITEQEARIFAESR